MLLAVIMGLEQPRRSVLSKRRWRRRLLLVSFCRMIVFTRNLSGGPVLEKAVTPLDAGNHEGFRVSPSFHAARADDFACLRPSSFLVNNALTSVAGLKQDGVRAAADGVIGHCGALYRESTGAAHPYRS